MRVRQSTGGPFRERPYYTPSEIEGMCEEALLKVDLMPSCPEPIRIERFIEKRFGISPEYSPLPEGILGYTLFGSTGPVAMIVAKSLSEANTRTAERRINTTLAHEAGHCLLHAHLFALAGMSLDLFLDEAVKTDKPKILCRAPTGSYDGKWWEFQANSAIGPLLMPSDLVRKAIEPWLEASGLLCVRLSDIGRLAAEQALSELFDVNPIAARIRLEHLFPLSSQYSL